MRRPAAQGIAPGKPTRALPPQVPYTVIGTAPRRHSH